MSSSVKSKKNRILEATKSTLEGSTIHPIPHLVRKNFRLVKLIWLVCFLASVCICTWLIIDIVAKFLEREVVTRINLKPEPSLAFPIVYICSRVQPVKITERIIRARFDLTELQPEQEFDNLTIGTSYCIRFNAEKSLKYVKEKPSLSYLELELFIGSDLKIKNSPTSGLFIRIADQGQSTAARLDDIFIAPDTFNKIYVHRTVIRKQPAPYSDCVLDLDSNVCFFANYLN
jgi:hypothetical protein